jgi:2-octaprenyl-6-methoxyphenol hydroxylase
MHVDFDIAICGAGPVGLTLAASLVKHGVQANRIAVIDAKTVEQSARDPRSIALSYGSRQLLESVGAWPIAATPIHDIHVSRRGHFGRTLIDRSDYKLPALGYVTRYGDIVSALNALTTSLDISLIRPASVVAIEETAGAVAIRFNDRTDLHTSVLVQAEGGVFSDQAKKTMHRDYGQTAVVTHVTTSEPISHRAFERFTDEGPLALLPQDKGYALVWCAHPDTASRLLALTDAQFLAALGKAFGSRLGKFIACAPRNAFPLGLNAQSAVSQRTIAIGNAAQTLHPVAGQGLNLGLRDAVMLARILARHIEPPALQEFAAQRQLDRNITIHLTDIMARAFASSPAGTFSQALMGISLGLADGIRPAKRMLAEQMMFGRRG